MDSDSDDPRYSELETLEAIYPEIRHPDIQDKFTFEIELPVEPQAPVTVTFPAAVTSETALADNLGQPLEAEVDSSQVTYLPSLTLRITLPKGYPEDNPPIAHVSTNPQWLPQTTIEKLVGDGPRLWDEAGRDMVAFTYIDHVQRAAEDVFGITSSDGTLQVASEHKLAVLDYDIKAKRAAFEKGTYECGICLDPKKGSKCHKMLDCNHIFCLQCLLDFYNDAIKEGNLSTVKCLSPNCAKERVASQAKTTGKQKKPKTSLSPSELLQIGLTDETVKRYVALKYKTELESDKNTVYCPRQWCNGAARSKKHKKPEGLELNEVSDGESETEDNNDGANDDEKAGEKKPLKFDRGELLSICEDCGFAFCSRCFQSWHGELKICHPRAKDGELTEDQKASPRVHPAAHEPLPDVRRARAEDSRLQPHDLLTLPDALLLSVLGLARPGQPLHALQHDPRRQGHLVLYAAVGVGGGRRRRCRDRVRRRTSEAGSQQPPPPAVRAPAAEVVEDFDFGGGGGGGGGGGREEAARAVPQRNRREEPVAVAREAPLVLRLFDNEQPQGAQPAVPPAAPDVPPAGGRGQNAANRGGGAPARGRGRGGRGAGRGGGRGRRQGQEPQRNPEAAGNAEAIQQEGLDAAQQAWVRHFVQMALLDAEDEIEGGSDDDDDNFLIR
uniref:RING-type domain-containing protein n=1 Tax=Bionectria ochroleuca TaxID=29856 RepID=A0A8H7NG63_BIOOC